MKISQTKAMYVVHQACKHVYACYHNSHTTKAACNESRGDKYYIIDILTDMFYLDVTECEPWKSMIQFKSKEEKKEFHLYVISLHALKNEKRVTTISLRQLKKEAKVRVHVISYL